LFKPLIVKIFQGCVLYMKLRSVGLQEFYPFAQKTLVDGFLPGLEWGSSWGCKQVRQTLGQSAKRFWLYRGS